MEYQLQDKSQGFSLVELLFGLSLLGFLLHLALPAFSDWQANTTLKGVTDNLNADLAHARSMAIKYQQDVYVDFNSTNTSWCYGINMGNTCNCAIPNSCKIDNASSVTSSSQYSNIQLKTQLNSIKFEGVRGTADTNGSLTLENGNKLVTINLNSLGQVSVCSKTVAGYYPC